MRKKHRFPIFYTILVLFIIIAVIAINIGIGVLSDYLSDYEKAEPKYVAEEIFNKYYKSYDFDSLITLSAAKIPDYESKESLVKYLHKKYDGCEMSYHTSMPSVNSDAYKNETLEYEVQFGNNSVSKFSIKKGDQKTKYGFYIFEQNQFTLDVKPEKAVKINVPTNYKVLLNGREVDRKNIIEPDIQTDSCKLMPKGVSGLTFCTYQVSGLLDDPEIKVKNPEGKESAVTFDKENDIFKADIIYSDSLKEQYGAYTLKAIEKYAAYMGRDERWDNVKVYFDSTSKLYNSIRTAENFFVTDHSGYKFIDEKTSEFYAYDDNTFSCRVSFTHVMSKPGRADYKDKIDMTIYLRKVNGTYLIYNRVDR